jgi:fructokinase
MFRVGIDLGGTKIEGVALDAEGREYGRRRIPTEAEGGCDHIVSRVAGLYAGLVYAIDDAPHSLGVGTPGALSARTGLLKNSNTVCLNGRPLPAMLEAALHHPVRLENDANCFALAEALMGAGRGHDCVFGVIMGTGCGGGIVIGGQVRRGPQSIAGEWGHMVIDPAGPPCYCGARGCVETFISGGGFEKRFAARTGRRLSVAEIMAGAAGDADCASAADDFYARFGQAVANLLAVLDPDIVVLGGGLSNLEGLYSRGIEAVRRRVFSDELTTPIVRNLLGDSAGVVGAALAGAGATPGVQAAR